MMVIKVTTDGKAVGDKRQHLPVVIRWTCPGCGLGRERDFSGGSDYFSHPPFNEPFETTLYCTHCDREVPVLVALNVLCTVVPMEET